MKEEKIDDLAEFIGVGIHTYLRKLCESKESNDAWNAINDMPPEEWTGISKQLAKDIIEYKLKGLK